MTPQEVIVPVSAMVRGIFDADSAELPDVVLAPHIGAVVSRLLAQYPDIGTLASVTRPEPMDGSDGSLLLDAVGWLVACRVVSLAMLRKSGGVVSEKTGLSETRYADPSKAWDTSGWLAYAEEALAHISGVRDALSIQGAAHVGLQAVGPRRTVQGYVYGSGFADTLQLFASEQWLPVAGYAGWGLSMGVCP